METRTCENCGETVDAAKAFCPGCGNAFVEERAREKESEFESHDSTVQLGQTMYNQMLSDMGLNISKAAPKPAAEPKKAEVVVPLTPAAPPPVSVELKPAAPPPAAAQPAKPAERPKTAANTWVWIAVAAGVLVILIAALIIAAGVGFYIYSAR
jgi:hypothetical protein